MTETPETETSAVVGRTPGEILKQAREGKDLSIAAIATQLNLDLRTVEALERGDLSRLPAPIFVRGYLRGYARLVGVREEEVLGAYQSPAPQEPAPRAVGKKRVPMRPAFRGPAIPWGGLFGVLALIVLAGVAFEFGPALMQRFMPGEAPQDMASAPELALPEPADGETATSGPPPGLPPVTGGMELPLPEPAPKAVEDLQPPAEAEPEPDMPGDTDFGADAAPAVTPAATPAAGAPAAPALSPGQVQLEFSFAADSWVEVRGADRSKLLFGLLPKGESRSVTGKAPVSVLLGNASAVVMKVNGETFDHARYARNNIARFSVPAQN